MPMTNHDLLRMPKAELHLHIEGSLEPEMCFALAERNSVTLTHGSVDELRAAYQFGSLQDFLDLYYQGMNVLLGEQDYYDLTWAYMTKCRDESILHTEIFFDPQGHTERGVPFEHVLTGITRACDDAHDQLSVTSKLIFCILRHLDAESAERTLDQALEHKDRLVGIGLDSSEIGHPPSKFTKVFERARKEGFLAVAHAGEEGPAESVGDTLDLLGVRRIDHGIRAIDDDDLVERLAREEIPLTICPLSNLKLRAVPNLESHPVGELLERGIRATINSDDPAYFGGYLTQNYIETRDALGLTDEQIVRLARNSFRSSFLADDEINSYLEALDAFVGML